MENTLYKTQVFVNSESTSSTGNIVCYDGFVWDGYSSQWERNSFVSICDGENVIHIRKRPDESVEDFIIKLTNINSEITNLIEHLKAEIEECQ